MPSRAVEYTVEIISFLYYNLPSLITTEKMVDNTIQLQ